MQQGELHLIGLAKNEEEIFFAGDKESLKLPYNSESLKLIRRIRDEVHRFGITFHRKKEAKEHLKMNWKIYKASVKTQQIFY